MDGEIYVWQSCVEIEGYSVKSSSPRSKWHIVEGQLEKQGTGNGTGNGTGTGTGTGTGNKNLREAAEAETTRSSRLLSSREPRTSRSKDSQ